MAPVSTPAVLLRAHDYGDTSRVLRFYTLGHGLLSAVARGVRGRSGKGGSAMTSFSSGDLVAYVKPHAELHTLKDFTAERARQRLGLDVLRFAGASSVAELVLAHTEQEPHPELFRVLERELDRLDQVGAGELPGTILGALWQVVVAFGFSPQLDACIACMRVPDVEEVARFDLEAGGLLCGVCAGDRASPRVGPVARRQLAELVAGTIPADLAHPRRHLALLADFVAHHVVQRPLKTLVFLGARLPADAEMPA